MLYYSFMISLPRKLTCLLLSLALFLAPMTGFASKRITFGADEAVSQMPCHSSEQSPENNRCPETGLSQCDCCAFAMPVSLTVHSMLPGITRLISQTSASLRNRDYPSQQPAPPERPPRFFV